MQILCYLSSPYIVKCEHSIFLSSCKMIAFFFISPSHRVLLWYNSTLRVMTVLVLIGAVLLYVFRFLVFCLN